MGLKPWKRSGEPVSPATRRTRRLYWLTELIGTLAILAVIYGTQSVDSKDIPFGTFSTGRADPFAVFSNRPVYRAMLEVEPEKGRAVVVLINSAAEPSAGDLGLHILLGTGVLPTGPVPPAPPPPTRHTEIVLPAAELEKFVGRYDFGNGFVIAVNRDGGTLRALREGVPGAQALPIFPEAPLAFFWKAGDAQIRFTTDAGSAVTGAALAGKRMTP